MKVFKVGENRLSVDLLSEIISNKINLSIVKSVIKSNQNRVNLHTKRIHKIIGSNVRNKKIFVNLFDFSRRLDLRKIGKRPLEMLVQAGAFDVLDTNRHRIFKSLDALVAYSAAIHDQKVSKQVSLFGDCLLYTSPSPRDATLSRMPSSA